MKQLLKTILGRTGINTGMTAYVLRRFFYAVIDIVAGLFFIPLRDKAAVDPGRIRKILLIRIDRIGDLVLTTPAFRAVRRAYPSATIHLLVAPYTKDIVVNNPCIDRVLLYGIDTVAADYDLALVFHPGFRPNRLSFKSGARWRIGYAGAGGSFFLTRVLKDDRLTRVRHEVESALEVAAAAGCRAAGTELEVSVTSEGEDFAASFLADNGVAKDDLLIGIHPGSRQPYLRWTPGGYAQTADTLARSRGARIILFAGSGEEQLASAVAERMKANVIIAKQVTLTQLISLIKHCRLFIGSSTGPLHLAAGLRVPVVALFGPAHPLDSYREWGPWGVDHVIVTHRTDCPNCHPSDCRSSYECLIGITAGDVAAAAVKLLQGAGNQH